MASVSMKDTVAQQFGPAAENYRTSSVHAAGEDLAQLVAHAGLAGVEQVLDAGSGAGHTALAFAPYVAHVVSVDLAESMLSQGRLQAQERGLSNVEFRQADVEALPFANGSFDLVVSRYSAHHWAHPLRALAEFQRLLRPGGCLLLSDIVSYDDFAADTHLQTVELLRDRSHVRDHTAAAWQAMMQAAGFEGASVPFRWAVRLDFASWVMRIATPPDDVAAIQRLLDHAPVEVRTLLRVEPDHSFTLQGAILKARRP
jgi:ubiquinone/menaquinone biosynthesis C-methylase UbiE